MINLDITRLFDQIIIIIIIITLLYLGWKIRRAYKNFLFSLLKRRGKKGEKNAKKLLKPSKAHKKGPLTLIRNCGVCLKNI